MTTEAVLLLGLFAFLLLGIFLGDTGPRKVFGMHGPRLGARVEAQLSTGQGFAVTRAGEPLRWVTPSRIQSGKFE